MDLERSTSGKDTAARREQSAKHALDAFRERRRRRRAQDTYFGTVECLLDESRSDVEPSELERRRSSILEEAERSGMSASLAEMLYDVAWEEGLDPALALELVRTGLGVHPPEEGVSNAPDEPAVDKYLPAWMFPPTPTDSLLRERTLRVSFRKLRSLLEQNDDVEEAFRQFANEPDVGHFGY